MITTLVVECGNEARPVRPPEVGIALRFEQHDVAIQVLSERPGLELWRRSVRSSLAPVVLHSSPRSTSLYTQHAERVLNA